MTKQQQQVLREALQLPPRARAELAATLLHSLDEPEDADVEAAWAREIRRRVDDIDQSRVELVAWAKVKRRQQAKIRRARKRA